MTNSTSTLQTLRAADHALAKLRLDHAAALTELRRLRRKVRPMRHERLIDGAAANARLILHLRYDRQPASRQALAALGVTSEYRHAWALGLLRLAHCDRRPETMTELQAMVEKVDATAAQLLAADPENAMRRLRSAAGARYVHDYAKSVSGVYPSSRPKRA